MVMTSKEFIEKLRDAANHKTLYVMGGIGFPLNARGKQRSRKKEFNRRADRAPKISAASDDTFAMHFFVQSNRVWQARLMPYVGSVFFRIHEK